MSFVALDHIEERELIPGFYVRLIHSDNMTIGYFNIKAGSILQEHQHIHEQVSNVLSGKFEMNIDGVTQILTQGQIAIIPSNIPHSGIALTDCVIMDVFHPIREDYRSILGL